MNTPLDEVSSSIPPFPPAYELLVWLSPLMIEPLWDMSQAKEIFGHENQDLYTQFKELLVKHGLT